LKKQDVTKLQRCADKLDRVSSFLTIPNAFRQCTVTLPIIHSAIPRLLREKLPDCSCICHPILGLFKEDHGREVTLGVFKTRVRQPCDPILLNHSI